MLDFNSTPYFDDYDELKKFVRILFRPGKAVQTRELTQSQTILQNQISRLGDYNFEEGSIVTGAESQIDLNYNYVKIINPPPLDIIGLIKTRDIRLFGNTSKINARLVNYTPANESDSETIYVKYFDSGDTTLGGTGTNTKFLDNELLTVKIFDFDGNQEGSSFILQAQPVDSTGVGSAISVTQGVRYALGFFLYVQEQTLIIDKYDNKPTTRLGFRIIESIVTENDDPSLLDNALGSPNATAPGAHRYKIDLILTKTDTDEEESFINLATLEDGKLQEDLTTAQLASSGILVELAKRTYDANGDFIVEEFKTEIREHLDDGINRGKFTQEQGGSEELLAVDLDSGRAYVSGYEVKTTGQETITIAKAREESVGQTSTIFGGIGSYIKVNNINGFPDIENYESITIRDGLIDLGSARVRTIDYVESGDFFKLYLFDIRIDPDKVLSNADNFIGTGVSGDIISTDGVVLFERSNNVAIKAFPFNSVSDISDIAYDSHRTFEEKTTSPTGDSVIWSTGSVSQVFSSFSKRNYMIWNVGTGAFISPDSEDVTYNFDGTSITVSGLASSQTYRLIASVIKTTAPIPKIKSRQLFNDELSVSSDGSILLEKPDIIEVISILDNQGNNISNQFTLDNGQRDGYYGLGKLVPVNLSNILPEGTIVNVEFSWYQHGGGGDFFVINSYPEDDYPEIQNYISSNGVEYDLRNCIDFRPTIGLDGTFTGINNSKGDFWSPDTRINADVSFYLSRIDKIAVDQTGNFFAITGTPAIIPRVPADSQNGMSIMEITIPAYTFSPEDVQIDYIERKRFTMDDISVLEKRIENIEYYTALNLLEKDTSDRKILDPLTGDDRFKNGFIVDSFTGHGIGDAGSDDYKCSVDFAKGELRPSFDQEIVELEVANISNAVIIDEDSAILPYTEKSFINQFYASSLEPLNPNPLVEWEGYIKLRPNHTSFYDKRLKPVLISSNKNGQFDTVLKGSPGKKAKSLGTIWNFWQDHWAGRPKSISRDTIYEKSLSNQTNISTLNVPLVTTTVKNNKTVVSAVAAFLKPQTIRFDAYNLKPYTKVKGYFDGKEVGTYTTNKKGRINGTFSIEAGVYRAGLRVFVLTDNPDQTLATTFSEEVFYALGVLENRNGSIISIKPPRYRGGKLKQARQLKVTSQSQNVVSRRTKFAEPIAQTFKISEAGGCYLTGVDLFFGKKDSDIPITVEIREVEDGVPTDKILPFSTVTLEPETDVFVSSDATVPTSFNFEFPVFVQEDTEYAIIVNSNSARYQIFVSEIGLNDLRTNASISKQPYSGYLLRSDKSFNWTKATQRDMKFSMRKAVFDTNVNATIDFVNKELELDKLEINPIETFGTTRIRVYHENHGMFVNSNVLIEGATGGNGIDAEEINGAHQILDANDDWYEFDVISTSNASSRIGGSEVLATRNIRADYIQPITSQVRLPNTKTEWLFKGTTSGSHDNPDLPLYSLDFDYTKIDIDETTSFRLPKIIASGYEEENQSKLNGQKSARLRAQLSTTNPNVSPCIDLSRMGLIAVYSRINNDFEGEENASGGEAEAKYVSKKISLNDPAVGIRIIFDANRPSQSNIDIYYKTLVADSEDSFESQSWVRVADDDYVQYPNPNTKSEDFSEYEFKVDFEPEDGFTQFAVKIVMRSTDSLNVPRIKNFRAIALGT